MGSFLNNISINNKEEKENKKQKLLPNPNFKIKKTIVKTHKTSINICFKLLSCFEIYKLKNTQNSFFIAIQIEEKKVEILKYDFNNAKKISEINIQPNRMKYFYDEIYDIEYLIIQTLKEINIFLIVNEKTFKKLFTYKEEGYISRGAEGYYKGLLPISDFLLFYDKYNKINYLVVSFFYRVDCSSMEKKISILKLGKNNYILLSQFKSPDSEMTSEKIFLIWEDKISKLNYLIYNSYNDLILLKINYTNIEDNIVLKDLLESFTNYLGCIINQGYKKDYLYLFDNKGLLTIIDLNLKQTIMKINIINDIIKSVLEWNNDYILFSTKKYIYTFDINAKKLINKMIINPEKDIVSINKFIYEQYNFYSLIVDLSNEIIAINL